MTEILQQESLESQGNDPAAGKDELSRQGNIVHFIRLGDRRTQSEVDSFSNKYESTLTSGTQGR